MYISIPYQTDCKSMVFWDYNDSRKMVRMLSKDNLFFVSVYVLRRFGCCYSLAVVSD